MCLIYTLGPVNWPTYLLCQGGLESFLPQSVQLSRVTLGTPLRRRSMVVDIHETAWKNLRRAHALKVKSLFFLTCSTLAHLATVNCLQPLLGKFRDSILRRKTWWATIATVQMLEYLSWDCDGSSLSELRNLILRKFKNTLNYYIFSVCVCMHVCVHKRI